MKFFNKIRSLLGLDKKEKEEQNRLFLKRLDDENFIKVAKGAQGNLYHDENSPDVTITYRGYSRIIPFDNISHNDYCVLRFFRKYTVEPESKVDISRYEEHYKNETAIVKGI